MRLHELVTASTRASRSQWAPLEFGRHVGKTLPQIAWYEPGYVVWLATAQGIDCSLAFDAERLVTLMRSIRIPGGAAADYIKDPVTGRFARIEIVDPGAAPSGIRLDRIDLCVASDFARPDRDTGGDHHLTRCVRQILFGPDRRRMRRTRAEAFFEDEENFLWPEAFAPRKPPRTSVPSEPQSIPTNANPSATTNERSHAMSASNATVPLPVLPYLGQPSPPLPLMTAPVMDTASIFTSPRGLPPVVAPVLTRSEVEELLEGDRDWPNGLLGPYELEIEDLNVLRLVFVFGSPREEELVTRGSLICGRDIRATIERLQKGGLLARLDFFLRLSEMGLSLIRGEWDGLPSCRDPERDPSTVMLEMLVELSRARCGAADSTGYQTAPLTDEGIPYSLQFCRDRLVQQIDSMPSADRLLRMPGVASELECAIALFDNAVMAQKVAFLRFLDDLAEHLKAASASPLLGTTAKLQIRAAEVISLFEARARSSTWHHSR